MTSQAAQNTLAGRMWPACRAVASRGASGARPPGCCIHPILYFKNVAPLLVFGPSFWFSAPPAAKSWRRACLHVRDPALHAT